MNKKCQSLLQPSTHYTRAVTAGRVLQQVVWQYRVEQWWSLVSASSSLLLQCSRATADISSYIAAVLEALGPRVALPPPDKRRLYQEGLLRVLQVRVLRVRVHCLKYDFTSDFVS